ncbi:MAG: cobalt-precorrin-5B (C(1))-methyltransferase CbiD [Muribaculaceae bacterium]|nr:cobalt-precorrin-5B (C(1))-methyltransferase CbiD [Muribaculaceae bacterium]
MILIFGGTTEGRLAVEVAEKGGKPFYYSTLSSPGHVALTNGRELTGGMDESRIAEFCRNEGIRLIVDAAHPFATGLHSAVMAAASALDVAVVRVERRYPPRSEGVIWCEGWDDALRRLEERNPRRLLVLTGVKTIGRLKPFWKTRVETLFRILDREESLEMALRQGVERERILFYGEGGTDSELFDRLKPDAIITKESGESGGFEEKVNAALRLGIEVFVVARPQLPDGYSDVVTGRHGLRRAIEKYAPGFFDLRSGFTTGACATAAATAAMRALLTGEDVDCVDFELPDGEWMDMPVCDVARLSATSATASAIKDMSDDPDVTRGCQVVCRVELSDESEDIVFRGGEGVGVVTLPGIGLALGEAAINPVPRSMMVRALRRLYPEGGVRVTISVPEGKALAQHTFNPRIGIEGGISIIGTQGIVTPFSHEAFVDAIRREMDVAAAMGCRHIALNSGARSERFVRAIIQDLPPQAFIHYGNAIGDSLRLASELGFDRVTLSMMIGKAVKLAAGNLDTHSHVSHMDTDFIASLAAEAGVDEEIRAKVMGVNMASELWEIIPADVRNEFIRLLLIRCRNVCQQLMKRTFLDIILLDKEGHPYK